MVIFTCTDVLYPSYDLSFLPTVSPMKQNMHPPPHRHGSQQSHDGWVVADPVLMAIQRFAAFLHVGEQQDFISI